MVDHLPFLSVASFFRIASLALLLTYFNSFGFIPIAIYWIGTLIIGYTRLVDRQILTSENIVYI